MAAATSCHGSQKKADQGQTISALLRVAIGAMLKSKTFMPKSLWPLPKLTPAGGLSFWQLQILLVGVAVAVSGIFWLLQGITNPTRKFSSPL